MKTKATEEIHHIKPFSMAVNEDEVKQLAYDWNNFMPLCKECHDEAQRVLRKTGLYEIF